MHYVMYIQNGSNLGHAEFDDINDAYEAMKVLVARQIGVSSAQLESMMDVSGDGPFFHLHRTEAFVASNGDTPGLSINVEPVEEPLLAYAALNVEKTYICVNLMEQFYTLLDECHAKLPDLEMEPTGVLVAIGRLQGAYECLKSVDIDLDEETEAEYEKLQNTLKYYMGEE